MDDLKITQNQDQMTEVIIQKLAENRTIENNKKGRRGGIILSQEDLNSALFNKISDKVDDLLQK